MRQLNAARADNINQTIELFVATGIGRHASIIKYRRFGALADALRHAVEVIN